MASTRTYTRSFAGGELSKEMFGRIDDAKFQSGAALLRNMIATPTGSAENRPGFAFVRGTKNNGVARLIPFTYSLGQTMVIELGNLYARFHTLGQTLQYATGGVTAWKNPSGAISLSPTTPTVVSWAAHGLVTGDPIRFYIFGSHSPSELPAGFKVGYTYTVQAIDADNFNILDNGVLVSLPSGGLGPSTNYPGSGTASAGLSLSPDDSGAFDISAILSGLGSVVVPGGLATVNVTIDSSFFFDGDASGLISYQYSTGSGWFSLHDSAGNETGTKQLQIPIANIDTLQLRVYASGSTGSYGTANMSGTINAWSVDVPTGGGGGTPLTFVRAYRYYTAGDMVSSGPNYYAALLANSGGLTVPGTDATIWAQLPADLTYEIPTPYLAADLFDIRYAQSGDVLTLVHPRYPPAELRRLGATQWALTAINFGPPLPTPQSVAVAASPGYKAIIASISTASPALITTVANHTLALGDGIYIDNLTAVIGGVDTPLSGFYMVQNVPTDVSGNLIPNELTVMDYDGNVLDSSGWDSYHATNGAKPITIQFGSKIFNIDTFYAVQAIAPDGVSASALSSSADAINNLNVPGAYNTISWGAVVGAQAYYVFKKFNGLWGYIGQTTDTQFADNNINPDLSITPGNPDVVFASAGNYPGAVCYFEQRRFFAGTSNAGQNIWGSNSGTESMFNYSLPSRATDRLSFRVAALQADAIQHLVPMAQLLALTSDTEFAIGTQGESLTPGNLSARPQSYVGTSYVRPSIIKTTMVYAAARGGHVSELGFSWAVNGYATEDLSLRAAHLFDNLTILDQAYAKAPKPILWFVSSSGKLLGLTYITSQQIAAWHQHDTQGTFESICCVAEGAEDRLYAIVNRTINGSTVRFVERMASRVIDEDNPSTWFFVDAGVTQTFMAPVTEVSGLDWLEASTVAVLADGCVQNQKVVTGGKITLDRAASQVTIGLPYDADTETLPATMMIDGYGQGITKNISRAWVKVFKTSTIKMGPDLDHLTPVKQRTTEPYGSPPALQSDELEVLNTPSWQKSGQVFIRQSNPLPITVVGLTLEVSIGG